MWVFVSHKALYRLLGISETHNWRGGMYHLSLFMSTLKMKAICSSKRMEMPIELHVITIQATTTDIFTTVRNSDHRYVNCVARHALIIWQLKCKCNVTYWRKMMVYCWWNNYLYLAFTLLWTANVVYVVIRVTCGTSLSHCYPMQVCSLILFLDISLCKTQICKQ